MTPYRWTLLGLTVTVAVVASYGAAQLGDPGSSMIWCDLVSCGALSPGAAVVLIAAAAVIGTGVFSAALIAYLDSRNEYGD